MTISLVSPVLCSDLLGEHIWTLQDNIFYHIYLFNLVVPLLIWQKSKTWRLEEISQSAAIYKILVKVVFYFVVISY